MPTSPHTLARQVAPLRTGAEAVDADCRLWNMRNAHQHDVQPEAAHAACVIDDDVPPEPGSWLRSMGNALVLAVALVGAIVLICLSPFLPRN